jgi:ABC-2 type transport system ATP-binding protein
MTESAQIVAGGLTKWFGQVIAVNDVTFENRAAIVGLLGPNGAGKSTLIKLLTGQVRPSKGQVRVLGEDPWDNRRLLSILGYCPEHDRFYEDLTPFQFVELLTRLHGVDRRQASKLSDESIELVELTEKRNSPIRTLSHGMRQRLKVAQALAHKPKWIVLDEPLSGMDPVGRAKMIKLFRRQAEAGATVLVSSHVLHELEAMTSDILLINRGRLLAQGKVQSIRDLIDGHPHRIALTADKPRELGRELLKFGDVIRVEVHNERVVIETHTPDVCYTRIGDLAVGGEFQVKSMVSLDDNLEAVFRYLVK